MDVAREKLRHTPLDDTNSSGLNAFADSKKVLVQEVFVRAMLAF